MDGASTSVPKTGMWNNKNDNKCERSFRVWNEMSRLSALWVCFIILNHPLHLIIAFLQKSKIYNTILSKVASSVTQHETRGPTGRLSACLCLCLCLCHCLCLLLCVLALAFFTPLSTASVETRQIPDSPKRQDPSERPLATLEHARNEEP